MAEVLCLACMERAIRPHHVICRACYHSQSAAIQTIKEAPLEPLTIRQKLWGQRFVQNRVPKHRAIIAYAAYHLAAQGDEEVLQEVRVALLAHPPDPQGQAGATQTAPVSGSGDTTDESPSVHAELSEAVKEITFLESKLREGRATARRGPGSFRTTDGHYVRSKSERDIANFLFQHRVPYQYERPTWIGGVALCPDFFLPDVGENGLFLEHFGLIENADYHALAARKAQLFEQAHRLWIATDERDAEDMDAALRMKLGRYVAGLA